MAVSKALVVAIVAGLGLVATISLDATMGRVISVDVKDGSAWRTVAEQGDVGNGGRSFAEPFPAGGGVPVERNGSIDMRLRVDNGYFWSYDEHYVVRYGGLILAEGDLRAPARGTGESAFSVPAARFFADAGAPAKTVDAVRPAVSVNFQVEVGGKDVFVYFSVVEAS